MDTNYVGAGGEAVGEPHFSTPCGEVDKSLQNDVEVGGDPIETQDYTQGNILVMYRLMYGLGLRFLLVIDLNFFNYLQFTTKKVKPKHHMRLLMISFSLLISTLGPI